ncbi:hypothetical protein [Streptomyces bicolor]|uniref:hypothetical protein n=1 Tax=Streptomyces bicolor TaxID=66874 RepID=UPI0004E14BEC|nr:hypothetical protein [Streptomyces bicolor]
MLALRLTLGSQPAVQLRRLLVATASAGTGFLLLCALGYALSHPDDPGASLLRLAWCVPPLAATIHFAVAVARTDPGTKPRPGLSAIGLGPARLMAVSATTTALSCTLGSMVALLFFLHLRGDLTGMPFDGAGEEFLAADTPLPLPATLTLLTAAPAIASLTVAFTLRPKEQRTHAQGGARPHGRFGSRSGPTTRETFGAYGRFGAHLRRGGRGAAEAPGGHQPADSRPPQPTQTPAPTPGKQTTDWTEAVADPTATPDSALPPAPRKPPAGLPWGIAVIAAGLAAETYAAHATTGAALTLPAALPTGHAGVLLGWLLTALGLALAAPGLTHLCGRLLQSARPGALRLLAGRVLMAEAVRIGRPLGIVCAAASGAYAVATLSDPDAISAFGPLTTVGVALVTGCTVATLLTAAVEAKQARADTTAALLRLGAPTSMLRSAAALRAGVLAAFFGPLTLIVAELAALPLAR